MIIYNNDNEMMMMMTMMLMITMIKDDDDDDDETHGTLSPPNVTVGSNSVSSAFFRISTDFTTTCENFCFNQFLNYFNFHIEKPGSIKASTPAVTACGRLMEAGR